MAESVYSDFVLYYRDLQKEKPKGTALIFERNDGYSLYGDDAVFINKEILKASKLKTMHAGKDVLSYVNINRANFIQALKYLLFVCQYNIEILRNVGNARNPQWTACCKASPGNLIAVEEFLFGNNDSYIQNSSGLMSIKMVPDGSDLVFGIAFCDPVQREIKICRISDSPEMTNLQSVLVQLSPQECLLPATASGGKLSGTSPKCNLQKIIKTHGIAVTERKAGDFSTNDIDQDLSRLLDEKQYNPSARVDSNMDVAFAAVASLIKYLELLSDEHNFGHYTLSEFSLHQYAKIDAQTVIGLELFPENVKELCDKHYLFGHLNSCLTRQGERLLLQWLKQPLKSEVKIEERLNIVEIFVLDNSLLNETADHISKFPDLAILSRKIQRRNANLQDLYKIYLMVLELPKLHNTLSSYGGLHSNNMEYCFVSDLMARIKDFENFNKMLATVLDFEAVKNREFVVKAECDEELLDLQKEMKKVVEAIELKTSNAIRDLGTSAVKLEYTKQIGYHFRLTRKEEVNLRGKESNYIIITNTKASGIKFQSLSLNVLNKEYLSLRDAYEEKQKVFVKEIIEVAVTYCQPMKLLNHTIAVLDVSLAFARLSLNAPKPYVRPIMRQQSESCIFLKQVRHPVVETKVKNFIPNDIHISKGEKNFYFVTGPNMGGKSTFTRSVALSVLLAQIGCFVPCDEAEISIRDAILTRIGASDKPSKGVSTFMFEMLEVQHIMKSATPSSLLIIDEMGRGTSTFDGFGLSWAISEHIAKVVNVPCLFATHFHELSKLSETVPNIGNLRVEALSTEDDVIYLYRVTPGIGEKSFGIHVTKLTKFPEPVVKNAEKKLKEFEKLHLSADEINEIFSSVPGGKVITDAFSTCKSAVISAKQELSGVSDNALEKAESAKLKALSEILEGICDSELKEEANAICVGQL